MFGRALITLLAPPNLFLICISVACAWKNQTFLDGYRWKENGVEFFCASAQRVRPGCYLYRDKIDCTGAFTGLLSKVKQPSLFSTDTLENSSLSVFSTCLILAGIQTLKLISDEELFLCESGDEVRSLNDRCNKVKDCCDASDEKDCVQCKYIIAAEFKLTLISVVLSPR